MIVCSMPGCLGCQTSAGCSCQRNGIVYTPQFIPSAADSCEAMAKALELAKDHSELPDEILDVVDEALANYRKERG